MCAWYVVLVILCKKKNLKFEKIGYVFFFFFYIRRQEVLGSNRPSLHLTTVPLKRYRLNLIKTQYF